MAALMRIEKDIVEVYRHSTGKYLAGKVPKVMFVIPRAVAVTEVWPAHAQSIAAVEAAVGAAPLTFGERTKVWLCKAVGMPLAVVAAIVTKTGQRPSGA